MSASNKNVSQKSADLHMGPECTLTQNFVETSRLVTCCDLLSGRSAGSRHRDHCEVSLKAAFIVIKDH